MLARRFRFHGYGSLNYLFRHGQTIRGKYILLRLLKNDRRPRSRVAVVISRKVSKSAVVRNRIRRRIFEVVRERLPQLEQPYDMAFTALRPELADMPAAELVRDIENLLERATIWHR